VNRILERFVALENVVLMRCARALARQETVYVEEIFAENAAINVPVPDHPTL